MISTERLENLYEALKNESVVQLSKRLDVELKLALVQRLDKLIELLDNMAEWLPTRE